MTWLWKLVLKLLTIVKALLLNLSEYPGMKFLRPAGESLGRFLSSYNDLLERRDRVKQDLIVSKQKVTEIGRAVPHGGKQASPEASSRPPEPLAGKASGGGGSPAHDSTSPPGGSAGGRRTSPAATESKGTLMIDAFMQGSDAPPELKQRWLNAATEREQQAAPDQAKPAYYGTLMPPDRARTAESQPLGTANPQALEPLFSDTVRGESARHETTAVPPARTAAGPTERQPEAPSVQWLVPSRSEPIPRTHDVAAAPRPTAAAVDNLVGPEHPQEPWEAAVPYGPEAPMPSAAPQDSSATLGATHRPAATQVAAAPYSSSDAIDEGGHHVPLVGAEYSAAPAVATTLDEDQPAMIPLAERGEQLARLEYVCQWLREARQPLCPLNGALAILPLSTIEAGPREVVELQRAVKADLAAIQNELKLRFPATALAVGLEEDPGFEELVRRVGPERAKSQRFGHRFDVRAVATPSQLTALCARISGVFEDWVYAIYRERGSIYRAGNSHLFGLLCKVRTQLQERLVRILCGGFGHDPERAGAPGTPGRREPGHPVLGVAFSGCYFAATGRTIDRRAFVDGVFDKLQEEQDHVEWTKAALREDRHFRRIGWVGLLVAAACGAALLAGHFLR